MDDKIKNHCRATRSLLSSLRQHKQWILNIRQNKIYLLTGLKYFAGNLGDCDLKDP